MVLPFELYGPMGLFQKLPSYTRSGVLRLLHFAAEQIVADSADVNMGSNVTSLLYFDLLTIRRKSYYSD
jgi:hypothetical protein